MRPVYVTVVGSTGGPNSDGFSAMIPVDRALVPFNLAIATILVTGSATWTVQYTYDDITLSTFTVASATWFALPGITNASSTIDDAITGRPVRAVRLSVTAGSGTVQIVVMQGSGVGT